MSLFIILLISLVIPLYAIDCSIYDGFEINPNSTTVLGGRNNGCSLTCSDRYVNSYICYSDVTFSFDLWYWITFLGHIFSISWSLYCLRVMQQMEKGIRVTPQFVTILLNIFVHIIRIVWFCVIYNGRTPDVVSPIFETVLIKLGQTTLFTEIFCIILVWKSIVDSSQSMKKLSQDDEKKNYVFSISFSLFLMFVIFPLSIIGNTYLSILATVSNLFLIIIITGLLIGGIRYSLNIKQLLNTGTVDGKRKDAIRSIMFVIFGLSSCAFISILVIVLNSLNVLKNPYVTIWVWWFVVHTIEIIVMNLIAYSVSHKARHAKMEHKNVSNYYSENNSVKK